MYDGRNRAPRLNIYSWNHKFFQCEKGIWFKTIFVENGQLPSGCPLADEILLNRNARVFFYVKKYMQVGNRSEKSNRIMCNSVQCNKYIVVSSWMSWYTLPSYFPSSNESYPLYSPFTGAKTSRWDIKFIRFIVFSLSTLFDICKWMRGIDRDCGHFDSIVIKSALFFFYLLLNFLMMCRANEFIVDRQSSNSFRWPKLTFLKNYLSGFLLNHIFFLLLENVIRFGRWVRACKKNAANLRTIVMNPIQIKCIIVCKSEFLAMNVTIIEVNLDYFANRRFKNNGRFLGSFLIEPLSSSSKCNLNWNG